MVNFSSRKNKAIVIIPEIVTSTIIALLLVAVAYKITMIGTLGILYLIRGIRSLLMYIFTPSAKIDPYYNKLFGNKKDALLFQELIKSIGSFYGGAPNPVSIKPYSKGSRLFISQFVFEEVPPLKKGDGIKVAIDSVDVQFSMVHFIITIGGKEFDIPFRDGDSVDSILAKLPRLPKSNKRR